MLAYPQDMICPETSDDAPALYDTETAAWLTYGELRRKVAAMAARMTSEHKQLVFIIAENRASLVMAYLAAVQAGHAIALIDATTTAPALHQLIVTWQPDFVIAGQDTASILSSAIPATSSVISVQAEIQSHGEQTGAPTTLDLRLRGNDDQGENDDPGIARKTLPQDFAAWLPDLCCWRFQQTSHAPIHPELFLLLSTSGSTGSTKFVRLFYRHVAANVAAIIEVLGMRAKDRAIQHMPLSYSFGLSVAHSVFAVGGSLVLTRQGMMQSEFWQQVRDRQCTLFAGVPSHYAMLQRLDLDRLNVPALETFLQAGGRASPEILQNAAAKIRARGGRLFVMYGQTEAAPRMTILPWERFVEKSESVGLPLPGGKISIIDGEIVYEGPNVMAGYAYSRPSLGLEDWMKGRLATGDLGYLDAEGFLFVTGRKARIAKIHGLRVALEDIEAIAAPVAPCVALEHKERLVIFAATHDLALPEKILDLVTKRCSLPRPCLTVRLIPSIPVTPNGKTDYHKLKDWA